MHEWMHKKTCQSDKHEAPECSTLWYRDKTRSRYGLRLRMFMGDNMLCGVEII